jgi:uncharacterized protein YecE (DUF72 family)
MNLFIGLAGWSLRKDFLEAFPATGTHLQRYAGRFNCVEINSSFYRPHRLSTYQRWADSTPGHFRFSVKLPKQITHVCRLAEVEGEIDRFLRETSGLGEKLGAILVQLPPSLAFEASLTEQFFQSLRTRIKIPIACEPRHATWFETEAESLLAEFAIDRVAADPSIVPFAAEPGGIRRHLYFRWHGSPQMYYSAYDQRTLRRLANQLVMCSTSCRTAWCIFDNTAMGAAIENALSLCELFKAGQVLGSN